MASKEELYQELNDSNRATWAKSEVKNLITRASVRYHTPERLKKGDVILVNPGIGKKRPGVIVKVMHDYVLVIPLSTTEDVRNLCVSSGSRFFKEGFFSRDILSVPIDIAMGNFISIYDNMKAINNAIKEMKSLISKL
jgi:hypothetical protein